MLNKRVDLFCFRKRIGEGFEEAPGSGSGAQRFQHVLHLASSSGEFEKVSQVTTQTAFSFISAQKPHLTCSLTASLSENCSCAACSPSGAVR